MVNLEALERPNEGSLNCLRRETHRIREKEKRFGDEGFHSSKTKEGKTWHEPKGLEDLIVIQQPQSQRDPFMEYVSYKLYTVIHWLHSKYTLVCQNAIPRNAVYGPF